MVVVPSRGQIRRKRKYEREGKKKIIFCQIKKKKKQYEKTNVESVANIQNLANSSVSCHISVRIYHLIQTLRERAEEIKNNGINSFLLDNATEFAALALL